MNWNFSNCYPSNKFSSSEGRILNLFGTLVFFRQYFFANMKPISTCESYEKKFWNRTNFPGFFYNGISILPSYFESTCIKNRESIMLIFVAKDLVKSFNKEECFNIRESNVRIWKWRQRSIRGSIERCEGSYLHPLLNSQLRWQPPHRPISSSPCT